MTSTHPEMELRGRQAEREVLDRLLQELRTGQSQSLVLRGEAGIGKTALLDYLLATASDLRIARAVGVESEMELAFAGVHQLCAPLLTGMEDLPVPQRDALGTAFGLSAGDAPDRFLVGLAVLGLLSEAAAERPVVCVVDDAQWLDRASGQVLAFVARRLMAESVALVFAVREPSEEQELRGLPELHIAGLTQSDARALLDSVTPARLDRRIRDRIVAETKGNPLALLELPRGLTPAELEFGFAVPAALPMASRIEQGFLRQLQPLPEDARRFLLIASVEPVGDVDLLWRAAARLGVGADAAGPAEEVGLVKLGARVRFRHPLVRSAVVRAAGMRELREVHAALADVTDPDLDPDRRAWHRAYAANGPDEAVADELERSAGRAQSRGGIAAAAAFLERATELTPDPARRGVRALEAAQAKFEAAAPDSALDLLMTAELCPLDALQTALAARLRAHIVFARGRGRDAPPLLLDAARRLAPCDGELARETYLEALAAAAFAGRFAGSFRMRDVASAARDAPTARLPPRPVDVLLDGLAILMTDGYAAGLPVLRDALALFREEALRSEYQTIGTLWLALPIAQEAAVHQLWDYDAWNELATSAVRLARDAGALAHLPVALIYLAGVRLHAGEFTAAAALIDEADAITTTTSYVPVSYATLVLAAWRGDEARAMNLVDAWVKDATARGEGMVLTVAGFVNAVLYNGLGRYEAALASAEEACASNDLGFVGWSLVELVEAAVRSGAHDEARDALRQLEERTRSAGTDWALGVQARSAALLNVGQAAEALYVEAIERLERSGVAVHLGRAHLLYGEWLRREHQRQAAREHLRAAYAMLTSMGVDAFAERAYRELRATGETARRRTADTRDVLTAQEGQIARLAVEGHTNAEIGSQLFISPRTVEYHLGKVFTKLGIGSRRELRGALARGPGDSAAPV